MTRITVGAVDIRTDLKLSYKQLRTLMIEAGALAAKISEPTADEPERPALGFGLPVSERLPDDLADPP